MGSFLSLFLHFFYSSKRGGAVYDLPSINNRVLKIIGWKITRPFIRLWGLEKQPFFFIFFTGRNMSSSDRRRRHKHGPRRLLLHKCIHWNKIFLFCHYNTKKRLCCCWRVWRGGGGRESLARESSRKKYIGGVFGVAVITIGHQLLDYCAMVYYETCTFMAFLQQKFDDSRSKAYVKGACWTKMEGEMVFRLSTTIRLPKKEKKKRRVIDWHG